MEKENLKNIMGPMRPPFLILTPACVLLGLGAAIYTEGRVNPFYFIMTLIGAVASHIAVNAFNEYFDFRSGLDLKTVRTPFSGGSGTLPANPHLERQALTTAVVSSVITALVGIYFLSVWGLALLPIGLIGLLVVVVYSPWLAHNPWLCLIAPGLGFGPIMVLGTCFVLTGRFSWTAVIASMVPFFLVSNLLLLNQFPDVEADKSIGRKHFPILIGRQASSLIYGAFLLLSFVSIGVGVALKLLPPASLLGLLAIVLAVPAFRGAYQNAENIEKLIPSMGQNVMINIVTPVLVAIGLFIG